MPQLMLKKLNTFLYINKNRLNFESVFILPKNNIKEIDLNILY